MMMIMFFAHLKTVTFSRAGVGERICFLQGALYKYSIWIS